MKFSLLNVLFFTVSFQIFSMHERTLDQLSASGKTDFLYGACTNSTPYDLEEALDTGISPDTTTYPLLMQCLNNGQKEHIDLLLNRGAAVTIEHIFKSIQLEDIELFGRLIHQCKNFDCNEKLSSHNNETLLHRAGHSGSPEIAEKLISLGADLEAEDDFGYTPFFTAVANKNIPVIKKLFTNGANIHKQVKSGESAFSRLQATLPDIAEEISQEM
jgi:ankyrin repeat protein